MTNGESFLKGGRVHWTIPLFVVCTLAASVNSKAGENSSQVPAPPQANEEGPVPQLPALVLTAIEAYAKWTTASDKPIILDVRTPEEFLFVGHAAMAWNVPLAAQSYIWDPATNQFPMTLLPDFVSRVEQIAKPDNTLLVMCRSGNRSAQAVKLLQQAGFRNVYNVSDGMEGELVDDPRSVFRGQRMVNGWKNSGLPWTYDVDPKRMILPTTR
jgi:rhodanese-related sulfurtransferase